MTGTLCLVGAEIYRLGESLEVALWSSSTPNPSESPRSDFVRLGGMALRHHGLPGDAVFGDEGLSASVLVDELAAVSGDGIGGGLPARRLLIQAFLVAGISSCWLCLFFVFFSH